MRTVREASDGVQARRYFVRGRVQGVGYRWFVQKNAIALRISGYVRNLDDGRVEVYAVGTPEQLNELCGLLWRGPRMSDVRGVDEQESSMEKVDGFRVDR
jgi:acylphosphatase